MIIANRTNTNNIASIGTGGQLNKLSPSSSGSVHLQHESYSCLQAHSIVSEHRHFWAIGSARITYKSRQIRTDIRSDSAIRSSQDRAPPRVFKGAGPEGRPSPRFKRGRELPSPPFRKPALTSDRDCREACACLRNRRVGATAIAHPAAVDKDGVQRPPSLSCGVCGGARSLSPRNRFASS